LHISTADCETLVMPAARPGLVPIMQRIQTNILDAKINTLLDNLFCYFGAGK